MIIQKIFTLESLFDTVDLKLKRFVRFKTNRFRKNINDDAELETHFDECDNNENIIRKI